MSTSALIMMVSVQLGVTLTTAYFFYRVLNTPPRPGQDSYAETGEQGGKK